MKGFTLLEIIIVISVLLILATLMVPGLAFLRQKTTLDSTAQEIIQILRLAQSKTLASEGANNFGVYFDTNQFVLFTGTSYNATSTTNEVHLLSPLVQISQINLGGQSAVVFERLSGTASPTGSIQIAAAADVAKNKNIFIDLSGSVSLESVMPADADRLTDSRHTHFIYNQNAKEALTLSLAFAGLTQNIAFQDFLNPAKNAFEWEDTLSVNGQNQTIRIHTHFLTDGGALFCVHRDRRQNTFGFSLGLDGQNLINYADDGQITQGLSVWVGTPEIQ